MSDTELLDFLLALQRECGGVVPFHRYMQEALYHPKFGYYSAHIRDVGVGGDFSTAATLDQGLGVAIAAWIPRRAKELHWRRIPVIEIGAGSGALARSVLRNLDWKTRLSVRYMIHETSPVLRRQQEKFLSWEGVKWITSLEGVLTRSRGKALIFSNELADAFPCRVFEQKSGSWNELGVKISQEGSLSETFIALAAENAWFEQFGNLPEGQRVERLDSFRDWLYVWSEHWKEGASLTIDYGETAGQLYQGRKGGSLRAYWRHQRFVGKDLYARFGKQDLTSDVNFSDLIKWGEELGWRHSPLLNQREFVQMWFSETKRHPIPSRFSTLGDAGDAFKVLEQRPGI